MLKFGGLALALMLAGCATSYQPMGATGGFSEVQLNADTFQINVSGNGFTSTDRARNIALLRASELTLKAGGERFVVLSGDISQNFAGTTPVTVNRIGNSLVASGGNAIFKPGGLLTVRIVRPKDPEFRDAFDAKLIDSQLRPLLVRS